MADTIRDQKDFYVADSKKSKNIIRELDRQPIGDMGKKNFSWKSG